MASLCTQRTLRLLREQFTHVEVTEHWNHFGKNRKDLFNFGDCVAIGAKSMIVVQSTAGSCHAARKAKILKIPAAKAMLKTGAVQIWIVSWKKRKKGKVYRWEDRTEFIRLEDFK